jgi:hypothetical protein
MSIYEMYTGDDGATHIDELSMDSKPSLGELESVEGIYLRQRADEHMEAHPAPEERWLVVISGFMEMTPVGGEPHRFGAGDIIRISDTTGTGHTTTFFDNPVYAVMPM